MHCVSTRASTITVVQVQLQNEPCLALEALASEAQDDCLALRLEFVEKVIASYAYVCLC